MTDLLLDNDSKSTQRTIKRSINAFRSFLKENGDNEDFEMLDKEELNDKLRIFFASIKKKGKNADEDGGLYKRNAFVSLRYGLSKYIKKEMEYDIVEDVAFSTSQESFQAVYKKIKKCGKGGTDHYPPITDEDVKKLYDGSHHAFNVSTPVGLQQKVWFEVVWYLCRRGRENQREMTKETFKVSVDASGKEYVAQDIDECDKNHGVDDNPDDTVGEGRIYAVPGRNDL